MPNWVKGTFKARGARENIEKFVLNGLEGVGFFGNAVGEIKITYQHEDETDFSFGDADCMWIKDTHRHFLECGGIEAYERRDGSFIFYCPFKAAWGIDEDSIAALAKEYGIKIRANGFECGMEFEQTVEADENGNIVLSEVKKYDDYSWECPMPGMGG